MKLLIADSEFDQSKSREMIAFECDFCHRVSTRSKHDVQSILKKRGKKCQMFCDSKCSGLSIRSNTVDFICTQCGGTIKLKPGQITTRSNKGNKNHFCSHSCNAKYNNTHKTKGTRRSKLEVWLESELTNKYPNLIIDFNKKDVIGSELDIYIPALKLAFELNGIFHYEPIFGKDKLGQTQANDKHKLHSCIAKEIDLCIIDVSWIKYFKEESSNQVFGIITKIIDERMARPTGATPAYSS